MPPPPTRGESRPLSRAPAVERRRKVFTFLVGVCVGTLLLGLIPALRWVLWIHLFADFALAILVALLLSVRSLGLSGDSRGPTIGSPVRRDVGYGRDPAYAGDVEDGRETSYARDAYARDAYARQAYVRQAGYGPLDSGMFEPAGHGYRLTGGPADVHAGGRQPSDPPTIRVLRPDDPPGTRLSARQDRVSRGMGGPQRLASMTVGPSRSVSPRPRMFLDDEEDFPQAQGL